MILVLAVNGLGEVLVAGLRQTVLLIQDVQDSDQLGLHQVWVAHRQHRQCRSSTVGGWGAKITGTEVTQNHEEEPKEKNSIDRLYSALKAWVCDSI